MDNAPKDGSLILGYEKNAGFGVFYYEDAIDGWCNQDGAYQQELLYWMPLPEAP